MASGSRGPDATAVAPKVGAYRSGRHWLAKCPTVVQPFGCKLAKRASRLSRLYWMVGGWSQHPFIKLPLLFLYANKVIHKKLDSRGYWSAFVKLIYKKREPQQKLLGLLILKSSRRTTLHSGGGRARSISAPGIHGVPLKFRQMRGGCDTVIPMRTVSQVSMPTPSGAEAMSVGVTDVESIHKVLHLLLWFLATG